MNTPIRTGRCLVILTLLASTQVVVNAEDEVRWSWQKPQAKVLPTGDLEWAPEPFAFRPGASVRLYRLRGRRRRQRRPLEAESLEAPPLGPRRRR